MSRSLYRVFSFVLIISLFACKRNVLPVTSNTNVEDEAVRKFRVNEIYFNFLHLKSKVRFKDEKNDINFTVNTRMKKDSVIWMSISPGVGIEAVRCLITTDSIFVMDRMHNTVYSYGFDFMKEQLNIDINFSMLQSLIVGNLMKEKAQGDKLHKEELLGFFLLTQTRSNIKIDNYVQLTNLKIEKVELLEIDSENTMSVKYSEFMPVDTFLFANKNNVVLKFKKEEKQQSTEIDIQHNKIDLSSKELNFPFNIPKKYEGK